MSIAKRNAVSTWMAFAALASGLLVAEASFAAEPDIISIRPAQVLDVRSGKLRRDVVVQIQGERILSVDSARGIESSGARTIDLPGLTLLPGLIDAHTHLTYDLADDWINQAVKESLADLALRGVRNARRTLMAGFTTVSDLGAWDFSDVALARAVANGWIEGPRIIPSGNMIGITGGHCDTTGFIPGIVERGPKDGIADGIDEVLKAVRYQIKHGAGVIKTCATAGVMSFEHQAGALQYSQPELDALVEEAARHHVKVAAHAHSTEGIIAATNAGVASIEHGSMLDDKAIALMKKRGTYLVPTVYTWRVPGDYPPIIQRKIDEIQTHIDGSQGVWRIGRTGHGAPRIHSRGNSLRCGSPGCRRPRRHRTRNARRSGRREGRSTGRCHDTGRCPLRDDRWPGGQILWRSTSMIAEHEHRVLDLIDAQQQEVVDFLRELLAFKTITPDEEVVEHDEFIRHQEFVKASLGKIGFGDFDIWEVDVAELEDRPGLGVVSDRDLRNMPVLVGRLPGAGKGTTTWCRSGSWKTGSAIPGAARSWTAASTAAAPTT